MLFGRLGYQGRRTDLAKSKSHLAHAKKETESHFDLHEGSEIYGTLPHCLNSMAAFSMKLRSGWVDIILSELCGTADDQSLRLQIRYQRSSLGGCYSGDCSGY